MLSSGSQAVYKNRIGWTRALLKKAGLIDLSVARCRADHTIEAGTLLIQSMSIDNNYLRNFLNSKNSFVARGAAQKL